MTTLAALKVVDTGLGDRERATLSLLAGDLVGDATEWVTLPPGLPEGLSAEARGTAAAFAATPDALVESWRVARHLDELTSAGDVVLVSDRHGRGGVFALEQWTAPPSERRTVLIAAADSAVLEYLCVAGTAAGAPVDVDFAMDWELAGYRFAAAIVATSAAACDYLGGLGLRAHLVVRPRPPVPDTNTPASQVWLPEAMSRLSGSGKLLRGLSAAIDELPDLEVRASRDDRTDHIFTGTSWQALAAVRQMLGPVLRREDGTGADLVALGDPFAVPPPPIVSARVAGTRIAVRDQSTAAALWPDAPAWRTEADLAAIAAGGSARAAAGSPPGEMELRSPRRDDGRARRVSVGVPLFGDVTYLDACLRSIVSQTESPHEVLLIDDGSRSGAVTEAIARWEITEPDVIRGLVQSPNQGVSAARNLGLENMTGDAFVFVDADDELHPGFIAACAATLRADADVWAVATWTEFFGAYEAIEAKPPFDRRVGMRENPIVSTTVLVDMKVRDAGLRFDQDLAFIYCEDWELWSRVVAAGGSFGLVPRPLARHRVHRASGGFQRTELAHSLGKARAVAPLLG